MIVSSMQMTETLPKNCFNIRVQIGNNVYTADRHVKDSPQLIAALIGCCIKSIIKNIKMRVGTWIMNKI